MSLIVLCYHYARKSSVQLRLNDFASIKRGVFDRLGDGAQLPLGERVKVLDIIFVLFRLLLSSKTTFQYAHIDEFCNFADGLDHMTDYIARSQDRLIAGLRTAAPLAILAGCGLRCEGILYKRTRSNSRPACPERVRYNMCFARRVQTSRQSFPLMMMIRHRYRASAWRLYVLSSAAARNLLRFILRTKMVVRRRDV
ncbi:hypothetical protein BKA62DRAFT_725065 [Auriculariales sp. MPI-PUGE-AT-0066]|nr:hypothetical protein BKA62DRAFT_725065 [Auriculariales sp. MPI-PUGE-AT-0066]